MKKIFALKTDRAFRQIIYFILAMSGLLMFFFYNISQKIYLAMVVLVHKIKTACDCPQMLQFSMHPFVFTALGILGVAMASFLGFALYKLVFLWSQTKKYTAQYLVRAKNDHSIKLKEALVTLSIDHKKVIEIRHGKAVVFCFGIIKTKICISNSLIKILTKDELEVVLKHEYRHLISREPLKLFIVKYFQTVFFFLPGLRAVVKKYLTFSELAADEAAANNLVETAKLARAILKISDSEEKYLFRTGLAVSFFTSVVSERVNRLSDSNYVPKFKLSSRGFFTGITAVLIFISLLLTFLSDSDKVYAMHNNNCVLENKVENIVGTTPCALGPVNHEMECSQDAFNAPLRSACKMK